MDGTGEATLCVIGIGAGDLGLLTAQAAAAIARVDLFLVLDKGEAKSELLEVRRAVLARHAGPTHRVVEIEDPVRDPSLSYEAAVAAWHEERIVRIEGALVTELQPGGTAGILVWGDPAWFDSTLRLVERLEARGRLRVAVEVIPGVSSLELLAARHRVVLNRIGRPVLVTTGRRLRDEGLPTGVDDAVVVLDGGTAFLSLLGQGFEIYWGAYLGLPDERLIAGPLDEVADEIVRVRAAARDRKGWIFDTYLVRRSGPDRGSGPSRDESVRPATSDGRRQEGREP